MVTHTTWSEWFINHPSNDAGNCNLQAFSKTLSSGKTAATKLKQVTEDINTVILGANGSRKIMFFHSPRNFKGTRTRQGNKLVCRLGMGPRSHQIEFGTRKLRHHRSHHRQTLGLHNCPRSRRHPSTSREHN